jgi:hypothetical protein
MALPMCPWALLSGATVFISVMGGYATFLAPICGLMVSDYLLVRRGNVKLSSLVSQMHLFGFNSFLSFFPRLRPFANISVRVRPELGVLLLERSELESTGSLGLWSCAPFPWLFGDCFQCYHPTRSSEGILSLLPA